MHFYKVKYEIFKIIIFGISILIDQLTGAFEIYDIRNPYLI